MCLMYFVEQVEFFQIKYIFFYVNVPMKFSHTSFFSFLLNLFGWYWLTKWYRLQVHNSTTHHLCTGLCVHHPNLVPFHPLSSPLHPPLPPSTTTVSSNHHTAVCVHEFPLFFIYLLNSFTTRCPPSLSPCQLSAFSLS